MSSEILLSTGGKALLSQDGKIVLESEPLMPRYAYHTTTARYYRQYANNDYSTPCAGTEIYTAEWEEGNQQSWTFFHLFNGRRNGASQAARVISFSGDGVPWTRVKHIKTRLLITTSRLLGDTDEYVDGVVPSDHVVDVFAGFDVDAPSGTGTPWYTDTNYDTLSDDWEFIGSVDTSGQADMEMNTYFDLLIPVTADGPKKLTIVAVPGLFGCGADSSIRVDNALVSVPNDRSTVVYNLAT
jgi:hypothetical protein